MTNRILHRTLLALLIACGIILILLSPLGLEKLSAIKGIDWIRLSDVGQTYGAASALVAGIALVGVVISIVLQMRSLAVSRIQMARAFHFDLIKFSIENPQLLPGWGFSSSPGSTVADTQLIGFASRFKLPRSRCATGIVLAFGVGVAVASGARRNNRSISRH